MGKYERWQAAQQNLGTTRNAHADAEGGSTKDHYAKTRQDLADAKKEEADSWEDMTGDMK